MVGLNGPTEGEAHGHKNWKTDEKIEGKKVGLKKR